MKIRHGFVSNSSSASFIVNIDMEPDKFLDEIYGHFNFSIMSRKKFKEFIENDNTKFKKYIEESKEREKDKKDTYHLTDIWRKDLKNHIIVNNRIIKNIGKMTDRQLTEAVLSYNHIHLHRRTKSCELISSTIMYNNAEDVPQLMQTIITHFAINHKDLFEVKALSDQ